MSQSSACAGKRYGLVKVCRVWKVARSTVYAKRAQGGERKPKKRGPKCYLSDEELLKDILTVLRESP